MRPSTTTTLFPGSASTAQQHGGRSLPTPGAELRSIIGKALAQRRVLLGSGRSSHNPTIQMGRLQQWLERNPCPSPTTVQHFPLGEELALVMPKTKGGATLLSRARALTTR